MEGALLDPAGSGVSSRVVWGAVVGLSDVVDMDRVLFLLGMLAINALGKTWQSEWYRAPLLLGPPPFLPIARRRLPFLLRFRVVSAGICAVGRIREAFASGTSFRRCCLQNLLDMLVKGGIPTVHSVPSLRGLLHEIGRRMGS
jgi:hypothetical protein